MTSRREFLASGGALIVSFSSIASLADELAFAQGPFATQDQRVARQVETDVAQVVLARATNDQTVSHVVSATSGGRAKVGRSRLPVGSDSFC